MIRIGLVADSHDGFCEDWASVVDGITRGFGRVDAILHCGDISSVGALDDLGRIAPVHATRSGDDPPPDPPRLLDGPRVVDLPGGHRVGLAFTRPVDAGAFGEDGPPVDAVVFGGTHAASVEVVDGLLWVNPGSPSLADQRTVAVLTLGDGGARAEIVPLR